MNIIKNGHMAGWWRQLQMIGKTFLFTNAVIIPVGLTAADEVGLPYQIKGSSMRPSFNPHVPGRRKRWWHNEVVWVNRFKIKSGGCRTLRPGDVVALHSPVQTGSLLIKRVVATPGERIRTRKDEVVWIPMGHYWCEGDNAKQSQDSNAFGPSKSVYSLKCNICEALICARGMRAILLADRNVQLYSTDLPPPKCVQLIGNDYETSNCSCRIKDVACRICGNTVGYHVTLPCRSCLASCNNGHFWMYHSNNVHAQERLNSSGNEILVWADIPSCGEDELMNPAQKKKTRVWGDCIR